MIELLENNGSSEEEIFSIKKEKEYNPEFVKKVLESKEDFKNGRFSTISLDEISKPLH